MLNNKKIIFIGPMGGGSIPTNGASVKNYHILNKLSKRNNHVIKVDTENWRKSPFVLIKLLLLLICNQGSRIIISTSNRSALRILKIVKKLNPSSHIIYWVIGGSIGKLIKNKIYPIYPYKLADLILVEGESMLRDMQSVGLQNVQYMPNFKLISNITLCEPKMRNGDNIKFVFISRIIPEKGCDLIVDAVRKLNEKGLERKYSIDFYGPIEDDYKDQFMGYITELRNIEYKGFLDLRNTDNYAILSEYDFMLFPTFWESEGCPGIIIDAYISGLPIIASEWNLNADYVDDKVTGILIESKSIRSLEKAMESVIRGDIDILTLKKNSQKLAKMYDIDSVLSDEILNRMGL